MAYPVAVIQPELEPGEVEANRHTVTRMAAQAVAQGARLVVLPEACASDMYREAGALAESIPGPTTEVLSRIAGNALIALPLLEKKAGKVFSSCAIVGHDGVRATALKSHLFRDPSGVDSFQDEEVISAGKELSLLDLGDIRLGVLIGFDAEFPESFRTLALRGADIVAVMLNCIEPDLRFLGAMARRNRTPLLVSNRIGFRRIYPTVPEFSAMAMPLLQQKDGSFMIRCKGGSAIIDENGRTVAEPTQEEQRGLESLAGAPERALIPRAHFQAEDILTASFRIDELRVQRLTSPYIAGRREELYRVKSKS
jgi:predicted amidohydrolase